MPSAELAKLHYAEHEGKPFFPKLVDFLTSGAVVGMVWEGKDVVKYGKWGGGRGGSAGVGRSWLWVGANCMPMAILQWWEWCNKGVQAQEVCWLSIWPVQAAR